MKGLSTAWLDSQVVLHLLPRTCYRTPKGHPPNIHSSARCFSVPLYPLILTPHLSRLQSTAPIVSSIARSHCHYNRFYPVYPSWRVTGFAQKSGIERHRYFGDVVPRTASRGVLGYQQRISLQKTTSPIRNSQYYFRSCFSHRIERRWSIEKAMIFRGIVVRRQGYNEVFKTCCGWLWSGRLFILSVTLLSL